MHYAVTLAVTPSGELAEVPVDGQTNRVLDAKVVMAKRDALFGAPALDDAGIQTGPVANGSFDDPIQPFERHHVVQKVGTELDDIIHDMDKQMHHNVEECGWEVHLELT
jgi:hypothetical protein